MNNNCRYMKISWSNTKFSELILKELYGWQLRELQIWSSSYKVNRQTEYFNGKFGELREGGRGFWDLSEIRIYQDWGNTCSEVMEIDIQISNAEKITNVLLISILILEKKEFLKKYPNL